MAFSDEILALTLARGATAEQAAEEAGCSLRTVRRRLAGQAFRDRITALRGEMVARASAKLADASSEAAEALAGLLRSEDESVRLRAARAILETGSRLREMVDLEERLKALEQGKAAGQ